MDLDNEDGFEAELNLDFSKYARHFVANEERYSGEEGFYFYQVQTGLEESPRGDKIYEDLETMADAGLLEKEEVNESLKMPETQYFLKTREENRTEIEIYAEQTRDWVDSYTESLRKVLPSSI